MKTISLALLSVCMQLSACDALNKPQESAMFEWIETMQKCPRLDEIDENRYPKLDPAAEALFQKAYAADDVVPRAISQEAVVKLYHQAAQMGHWVAMNNLAVSYYQVTA